MLHLFSKNEHLFDTLSAMSRGTFVKNEFTFNEINKKLEGM